MTGPEVVDLARDTVFTMLLISAPMMAVGLLVGVIIALFQALTQIQEMTLVFVPKIIVIFITMFFTMPYMGDLLNSYMVRIVDRIVSG